MKYFSKKVMYDGHKFDSSQERDRYIQLVAMQQKGVISDLTLQKEFEIIPTLYRQEIIHLKTKDKVVQRVDERNAVYTCDFFYYDTANDVWVVEEYKSPMTAKLADYVLRRKLIKHLLDKLNKEGNKQYVFKEVVYTKTKKRKK